MAQRSFIELVFGAVVLLSLASQAQQSAPSLTTNPTLEKMPFKVNGTSFVISMPREGVIIDVTGGQKVTFDLTKGGRLERALIIGKAGAAPSVSYTRRMILKNGGELAYRVNDDTGGGSGGPIAELAGQLKFGSVILSITCTDQEKGGREADWCLTYLGTLEITKQGQ